MCEKRKKLREINDIASTVLHTRKPTVLAVSAVVVLAVSTVVQSSLK